jgi:hypothetical protein
MLLSKGGGEMDKQQLKNIIDGMPDGMEVNDYLLELVNRALYSERNSIIFEIADNIENWDKEYRDAVKDATEFIGLRK